MSQNEPCGEEGGLEKGSWGPGAQKAGRPERSPRIPKAWPNALVFIARALGRHRGLQGWAGQKVRFTGKNASSCHAVNRLEGTGAHGRPRGHCQGLGRAGDNALVRRADLKGETNESGVT